MGGSRSSRIEQSRPMMSRNQDRPQDQRTTNTTTKTSLSGGSFPKSVSYAPVSQPVQPAYQPAEMPEQQYESVAQSPSQQPVSQGDNAYARGTRMGDAFIPPQPMEVSGSNGYASQISQQPSIQAQPAPAYYSPEEYQAQHQSQPQALQQARRKSPSLFERITSGYRRVEASIESLSTNDGDDFGTSQTQTHQGQQMQQRQQQRVVPTVSAPIPETNTIPAQGRLNIDAPSAPKTEEDELDIPAFLRRQTS